MGGNRNWSALGGLLLVLGAGIAGAAYLSSGQSIDIDRLRSKLPFLESCAQPIAYTVGEFDTRFGISRAEFESALREAAVLWNTAAGKELFVAGTGDAIPVNLVYSEYQRNAELGQAIDAEQQAYMDKRAEVEELRSQYLTLRSRFSAREASFERDARAYDEQVAYWNARGGAPPAEYERLEREQDALSAKQETLNRLADEVNALARTMNTEVEELNALAAQTNAKVGAYNAHAGRDFDQGTYMETAEGRRIDIYEFTDRTELKRVLAHELGHALGLGHVQNPESIMYSYNIGETFALSEEDRSALIERCGVE